MVFSFGERLGEKCTVGSGAASAVSGTLRIITVSISAVVGVERLTPTVGSAGTATILISIGSQSVTRQMVSSSPSGATVISSTYL
jgi:hypothetical protein